MKVLLSSIGTRGDVQPLLGLALALKSLGHEARLCVPPDFQGWIESLGFECRPIGPELRTMPRIGSMRPTAEQLHALAALTVHSQAPVIMDAARGCDRLVAATALQFTARSVAEVLGIPYVFAAYCPAVLPSVEHPPPLMEPGHPLSLPAARNAELWADNESRMNDRFRTPLNQVRERWGLTPVDSVRQHMFTDRPWLAADAALGPVAATEDFSVVQTGAWFLEDERPLPEEVEDFLAAGAPPVYLGLGSMRVGADTGRLLVETVRSLGMRSILSRGWGELEAPDRGKDCLCVDDVSHTALFPRMAAIVHHGGAGTTHSAARAGRPQLILPHLYDQPWWAHRVEQLGIGVAGPARESLSQDTLHETLRRCLLPEVMSRAQVFAQRIGGRGAQEAARRLERTDLQEVPARASA